MRGVRCWQHLDEQEELNGKTDLHTMSGCRWQLMEGQEGSPGGHFTSPVDCAAFRGVPTTSFFLTTLPQPGHVPVSPCVVLVNSVTVEGTSSREAGVASEDVKEKCVDSCSFRPPRVGHAIREAVEVYSASTSCATLQGPTKQPDEMCVLDHSTRLRLDVDEMISPRTRPGIHQGALDAFREAMTVNLLHRYIYTEYDHITDWHEFTRIAFTCVPVVPRPMPQSDGLSMSSSHCTMVNFGGVDS